MDGASSMVTNMYGKWNDDERKEATTSNGQRSMPYYELYAIVIAALHFCHEWHGKRITFITDCAPIFHSVNSGHTHSRIISRLLRVLSDNAVRHKYEWRCKWIRGTTNTLADMLSRGALQDFLKHSGTSHLILKTYHSRPIMAEPYSNK